MAARTGERKRAANRAYYHRNKERLAAYRAEYYRRRRSELLEAAREYREKNKERIAAWQRAYRERNKDVLKAYRDARRETIIVNCRRYRLENPDRVAETKRRYRERNRDKIVAYNRRYYRENIVAERERCRAKQKLLRAHGHYGGGANIGGIKALLDGRAGELARTVAQQALKLRMQWGVGRCIEDIVQEAIVELLCSPPPASDLVKHARRALSRVAARRTHRVSGISFECAPRLKRTILGEKYDG